MKKIKDYLHLYLGCECKEVYNGKILKGTLTLTGEKLNYFLNGVRNYKPILRPLSDMTDEEYLSIANLTSGASHLSDEGKNSFLQTAF